MDIIIIVIEPAEIGYYFYEVAIFLSPWYRLVNKVSGLWYWSLVITSYHLQSLDIGLN